MYFTIGIALAIRPRPLNPNIISAIGKVNDENWRTGAVYYKRSALSIVEYASA
jgi:hypothetical protein